MQREELEAALAEERASFQRERSQWAGERSQWAGERASLTAEVTFNLLLFSCILIINLSVVGY